MANHYFMYWRWDTVEHNLDYGVEINHIAGEQLSKLESGDLVWIITIHQDCLLLVGRIQVGKKVDYVEAVRILQDENLWDATWHIIAEVGTEEIMRLIDITDIIDHLRFISPKNKDRLVINKGKLTPMPFRSMRLLTTETQLLITIIWYQDKRLEAAIEPDTLAANAELLELRAKAFATASESTNISEKKVAHRTRSEAIRRYALKRAQGICEACKNPAPFITKNGQPFLEVHHIYRLADEGPDRPDAVIAICPNCHRRAHYGEDSQIFNQDLVLIVENIEKSFDNEF